MPRTLDEAADTRKFRVSKLALCVPRDGDKYRTDDRTRLVTKGRRTIRSPSEYACIVTEWSFLSFFSLYIPTHELLPLGFCSEDMPILTLCTACPPTPAPTPPPPPPAAPPGG